MRRIYFNVDWPAFWLRFAAGAAMGLLMGVYFWLSADVGWIWVVACMAAVGLLIAVFASEFWQNLYRWWHGW